MTATRCGTLYLLPTGLGGEIVPLLPRETLEVALRVEHFIAESPKTARSFLKAIGYAKPLQEVSMETLDEHTPESRIFEMLKPLAGGRDCALVSEAGCPAVADPGAALVRRAHEIGIRVKPLVGPSALLLAIMASGLNGQRFVFHGYLPIAKAEREQRLRDLERASAADGAAQMFIEAPYRNDAIVDAVLQSCQADTFLCVAVDLSLPTESVRTLRLSQWKRERPELNRRPSVFLIYREGEKKIANALRNKPPR